MIHKKFALIAFATVAATVCAQAKPSQFGYSNSINYGMTFSKGAYMTLSGQVEEVSPSFRGAGCVVDFTDLYGRHSELRLMPSAGPAPKLHSPITVRAGYLGDHGLIYGSEPRFVGLYWHPVSTAIATVLPPASTPSSVSVVPDWLPKVDFRLLLACAGVGVLGLFIVALASRAKSRRKRMNRTNGADYGVGIPQTGDFLAGTRQSSSERPSPAATFRVISGIQVEELTIKQSSSSLTIGRDPNSNIFLDNIYVSRLQAHLLPINGSWSLVPHHASSSNCYARTDPIESKKLLPKGDGYLLTDGVELTFGEVVLQFESFQSAWAEPIDDFSLSASGAQP